jgi:hypothetical protein
MGETQRKPREDTIILRLAGDIFHGNIYRKEPITMSPYPYYEG